MLSSAFQSRYSEMDITLVTNYKEMIQAKANMQPYFDILSLL